MRWADALRKTAVVLFVLAVAAYFIWIKKPPAETETLVSAGLESESESPPVPVKVAAVCRGELVLTLTSPGEAFAEQKAVLRAETRGRIKRLIAREGLAVREGDVLVEIDDEDHRLNLKKLEATRLKYLSEMCLEKRFEAVHPVVSADIIGKVERARLEYEAAAALFASGRIGPSELETADRACEAALIEAGRKRDDVRAAANGLTGVEIEIKAARRLLEKAVLRAPFSGILTDVKAASGEWIEAGREIGTLVDVSRLKVKATVLESEIARIRPGGSVVLRFNAFPGENFSGTIASIGPLVNPGERTCPVFIDLDAAGKKIKPGMYAEAELEAERYPDRLLVPREAILLRGGRRMVFVVSDGLAKWRYVDVGLENKRFAEVLQGDGLTRGVAENELVVIEGHLTLAHDSGVTVR